jgi:mannose-6-phosphate isomerase-like protein (cupin superfamily)
VSDFAIEPSSVLDDVLEAPASHFEVLRLPTFDDARGSLTVLDGALPFPVVRTYWIYGADGQTRGGHRHRHTRQALIAICGTVVIHMDDGKVREDIVLGSPEQCLIVEPKDWHTMHFGPGSILLVMSSHTYDRSEYIDDPYER